MPAHRSALLPGVRFGALVAVLGPAIVAGAAVDPLLRTGAALAVPLVLLLVAWPGSSPSRPPGAVLPAIAFSLAVAAGIAAWIEHARAAQWPAERAGATLALTGTVAGLPLRDGLGTRFDFHPDPASDAGGIVQLTWRAPVRGRAPGSAPVPDVRSGDRWTLRVRLFRPDGLANPGGRDAVARALATGVVARGYVLDGQRAADPAAWRPVDRVRERVHRMFAQAPVEPSVRGALAALTIGDGSLLQRSDWELLARTGTVHLLVVSGQHLALIAGVGWWLGSRATGRRRALWLAGALACGYALLAGGGVAIDRALAMTLAGFLALAHGRWAHAWRHTGLALLVVLAIDPLAWMQVGAWLSFAAVAVLVALAGRRAREHRAATGLRVLVLPTVALTPLLALQGVSAAVVAPVANLVCIPLVSVVLLPAALLALLATLPLADWQPLAWQVPVWLTARMFDGLRTLADAVPLELPMVAGTRGVLAIAGVAAALAWPPWRRLAAVLVVPWMVLAPSTVPLPGHVRMTVLDVGQGLAVAVASRRHGLLFDTGPGWGEGGDGDADAGRTVVLPAWRRLALPDPRLMVVSHADRDHAGGAASVASAFPATPLWVGEPLPRVALSRQRACLPGRHWAFDGVRLEVVAGAGRVGARSTGGAGNDRSCVLLVRGRDWSVLLPGDVGAGIERQLVRQGAIGPQSVVVAPHHGSRTSSSIPLVRRTRPAHVVFAVGAGNRFGHPHPEVRARWADEGACTWSTATDGAVQWDSFTGQVRAWRARPLWRWQVDRGRGGNRPTRCGAGGSVVEAG